MNARQKEVLQVQRSLLSKNIVWSSTLAASLKSHNLLTDSMIAQIEAAQGAENKIMVMLDLLPLRTSQVYDKFADCLHVSGHTLLADFLREEDVSKQPLNVKDLFKRLPFLSKNMKDTEKKQIEDYMSEKIQSAILAHTWQWDTKEKDKALVAKQEQLEQAHVHEQEMKKKHEQMLEAQRQTKEAREETMAVKAELRALTENASRMQQQMKGQMDTQMRFSMANDSITQRTNQRLQTAETTLKSIQDKLTTVVRLTPRDKEKDLMKLAENPFFFLPEDIDLFIGQFKKLLLVQLKYEDLMEERNYILMHLGLSQEKIDEEQEQAILLKAYKEFTSKNEEKIQSLKSEVARFGGLLEDLKSSKEEEDRKLAAAGTVWQNAIMSVMRKQLQDLKSSLRKKETTLGIKDAEIIKLRNKLTELETTLNTKSRELELASRALHIQDLHNGHTSSLDSLEGAEGNPHTSTSPRANNSNALPPLKSAMSHKTSSSPRPGLMRMGKPHVSVPRGVVMEPDTPHNMYPAGLTTMQLRVDPQPQPRAIALTASDPRGGKPPMGSTLGDLKAMHAHSSRYPGVSRGTTGLGLDQSASANAQHHSNKPISSPAARRKIIIKVK